MRQRLTWILVGVLLGLLFAPRGVIAQSGRLWVAASNGTQPASADASGNLRVNLQ